MDNAHFFDAKVGWVQIVDEVFWTHDGGDTWSRQPIPGRHSIPDVSSGVLMSVWFSRSGEVGWAAGGDFRWAEPGEEAPNYAVERDSSGRRAIERPAIYRTEDSGRSWQEQTLPGPYRGYHASLYVRDAQHALAVTEEDTFYTRDGGRRWYKGQFGKGCTSSRFFTSDPGKIWTAHLLSKSEAWIAFSGGRLFHTLDGGGRWCELAPGIPGARLDYLHFASATIGLSVNPFIALYETRDGGETWTDLRTGPRVYSMFFLDATDGWLVAREGLYRVTLR